MDTEQHSETQEKPAGEKPLSPAARQGQIPDRQGPKRPPFRRDNRGGRGGRGERGPRIERPRPMEGEQRKPAGSIRKAIEQVGLIRNELKKALDDLHEVLRILEQVEREKTASEEEIELLRESLRPLHRDHGHSRHPRSPTPSPPSASDHASPETDEGQEPEQAS